MASVLTARSAKSSHLALLALLGLGFAALFIPTLLSLAGEAWSRQEGIHGPIVLATGLWLIWRQWNDISASGKPGSLRVSLAILLPSLLLYIVARAFDFLSVEALAVIGVSIAIAYSFVGLAVLRTLWFPILYLMFLVPLPGWFVDQITAPLKQFVSSSAETLLSSAGYSVVRQGVTLYVDQYQLLVKDACAGLNSLFSLTAISLFYIYLRHNASWRYALFLLLLVVPIAVFANIMRVIILVLITHYWGEAAAQGFLHNSAGMLMFVIALLGIFAIDSAVEFALRRRHAF
jgi:exosortase B